MTKIPITIEELLLYGDMKQDLKEKLAKHITIAILKKEALERIVTTYTTINRSYKPTLLKKLFG